MINVTTIQQWFEDGISEAEQQDILNGFLTEVVINSIDLILQQVSIEFGCQLDR